MRDDMPPSVLVVDDTDAQRYALRHMLERAGFRVDEARNGQQALELARSGPDVILLDIKLPDIDGFEVCRRLKSNPETRFIPVIQTSAFYVQPERRIEGFESGADDYLAQPVSLDELVAKLKAWVRVRQAEAELRHSNEHLRQGAADLRRINGLLRQQREVSEKNESRLKAALEVAELGVWECVAQPGFWDGDMAAVMQFDDRCGEVFGIPVRRAIPIEEMLALIHPEDRRRVKDQMRGALALYGADILAAEYRITRPDGTPRWVAVHGHAIRPCQESDSRLVQFVGTLMDITERKQAEEALRAERDFSTAILETAAALVVVIDREGRITRVNRSCEAIVGYTAAEVCGRFVWEFVPAEQLPEFRAAWDALWAGGFPNQHENEWVARDGSRRPISWSNTTLVGPDGAVQYIVATGVDITEHRRAEEALIRSEKLASIGRMAATIAHEINNPLAGLMNMLYLARATLDDSDAAGRYLDMADAELTRISHITRQVLGFYREATAPTTFCLGTLLDSVMDLLKSKIMVKRVKVEKQCDEHLQITGVPGELRQVVSNLLANSLDAVDENGTIKLRASLAPLSRNGNGRVRVTIADNGKGIASAVLPHLFEPFFTTKDATGIGLGLWVAKQLVEKHHGSIRVHSCTIGPRRGTAVSFVLPAQAASEMHQVQPSAALEAQVDIASLEEETVERAGGKL